MASGIRIGVHQPNFFPHKAFFDRMASVDIFVLLIHCQYEKHNFQNRFKYGDKWHTMSVNRGLEPIKHKRYLKPQSDWNKITKYFSGLYQFNSLIEENLWETNTSIIMLIAQTLGIKTKIDIDYPTPLTGTDRLVDICKHHNATTYVSGPSGKHYLQVDKFKEAGITVEFQEPSESKPIIDYL